jgi:hypothetical protein
VQRKISAGQIDVGFLPEMVTLALGKPGKIYNRADAHGESEVWVYSKSKPQFSFGVGVGTAMVVINASLLSAYAFGCHSWRHLLGGRLDCFSCNGGASAQYRLWKGSSWLNERHMLFAWCSLVWVAFTDLYIYLLSTGGVSDLNTW